MTEKNTNVEEKPVHDGIAPIHVPEGDEDKAFQSLWEYLVPSSGKAQTAQGELIRIAGRVSHEVLDNGCMNWDEDFEKMLDSGVIWKNWTLKTVCCRWMALQTVKAMSLTS